MAFTKNYTVTLSLYTDPKTGIQKWVAGVEGLPVTVFASNPVLCLDALGDLLPTMRKAVNQLDHGPN